MASNTASRQAWKHSRRVAWRKVADEAVILDVETAAYFSLRGVGLRMWELLGRGETVAAVARALAQEYDAAEERIARDCSGLVAKLRKERLLERA